MRYRILVAGVPLGIWPAAAQDVGPALDPGAIVGFAGGAAVQSDNERRACIARYGTNAPRCRKPAQSEYEKWRNRPGKRDCGAYNWKCPPKPR